MKTLVLGASTKADRYSYQAAQLLRECGEEFVLVGRSEGVVAGEAIQQTWPTDESIDYVSIYLSPGNQADYYDKILASQPAKVIFNPGAENADFAQRLEENGIAVLEACTLVLLRTGQY